MASAGSGGVRFDFTQAFALTIGEDRTIRLPVYDSAGNLISDVSGYAAGFRVQSRLDDLDGWAAAASEETWLHFATGGDGIVGSGSNLDVTIAVADWSGMQPSPVALTPAVYWYEAWRTDGGDTRRLAYGLFEVID